MDSTPNLSHHHRAKDVPKQCEIFLTGKYPSSRRTASFSSCSSSLSPSSSSLESFYFPDDALLSPASPLRFSGVPFSWEQLPGIPKKHNSNKNKKSSMKLLPLPPPTITTTHPSSKKLNHDIDTKIWKKNSIQSSFQRDDPFFAAMVKCSKDDNDDNEEITSGNLWNNNGAKFYFQLQEEALINKLMAGPFEIIPISDPKMYLFMFLLEKTPKSLNTIYALCCMS
ncbi:hypothetical protein TSUD_41790 [Trifolium subterraneum]|nr:hypothetical protein TSUD_41790 [Trifolium subterraneum]